MKYTVSLKENRVFRRLYAKGRSAVSPTMVLYCRKNGRRENRLGLTTGTKLGHAVVRNRVRRRLREIYRLQEHRLSPRGALMRQTASPTRTSTPSSFA